MGYIKHISSHCPWLPVLVLHNVMVKVSFLYKVDPPHDQCKGGAVVGAGVKRIGAVVVAISWGGVTVVGWWGYCMRGVAHKLCKRGVLGVAAYSHTKCPSHGVFLTKIFVDNPKPLGRHFTLPQGTAVVEVPVWVGEVGQHHGQLERC